MNELDDFGLTTALWLNLVLAVISLVLWMFMPMSGIHIWPFILVCGCLIFCYALFAIGKQLDGQRDWIARHIKNLQACICFSLVVIVYSMVSFEIWPLALAYN